MQSRRVVLTTLSGRSTQIGGISLWGDTTYLALDTEPEIFGCVGCPPIPACGDAPDLGPEQSCQVQVSFTSPQDAGDSVAELVITQSEADGCYHPQRTIPVVGRGIPMYELSVPSRVRVTSIGAIKVANTGRRPQNVRFINVGTAPDFIYGEGSCPFVTTMPPGGRCVWNVEFVGELSTTPQIDNVTLYSVTTQTEHSIEVIAQRLVLP